MNTKDDELIEKMCMAAHGDLFSDSDIRSDFDRDCVREEMRAALAVARKTIIEDAAQVTDCFTSANIDPYQSGDASFDRGYDIGVIDAGKLIASSIRALADKCGA